MQYRKLLYCIVLCHIVSYRVVVSYSLKIFIFGCLLISFPWTRWKSSWVGLTFPSSSSIHIRSSYISYASIQILCLYKSLSMEWTYSTSTLHHPSCSSLSSFISNPAFPPCGRSQWWRLWQDVAESFINGQIQYNNIHYNKIIQYSNVHYHTAQWSTYHYSWMQHNKMK
jgi:hypothetical protein